MIFRFSFSKVVIMEHMPFSQVRNYGRTAIVKLHIGRKKCITQLIYKPIRFDHHKILRPMDGYETITAFKIGLDATVVVNSPERGVMSPVKRFSLVKYSTSCIYTRF